MSTHRYRWFGVFLVLACSSCGWKVGKMPDTRLSVGDVGGASAFPGLRAALRSGLSRRLAERGIESGPQIVLQVRSAVISPHSGAAGAGTVAFDTSVTVFAHVPDRIGCEAEVVVRRLWAAPGVAADTASARDAAVSWLADEVSVRVVDVLAGKAACQ